jgi:hypothetical protein
VTIERGRGGMPRTPFVRARVAVGLAGLALVAVSVPGLLAGSATAAAGGDGSDWGATGLLATDSAVTVQWDNDGNPAASVVPRDGRQQLPHTDGRSYDDLDPTTVNPYLNTFGANNGFGGLKVTVSQTQDLVNQSVTLDISGVKGGAPFGLPSNVYLQAFQCWGGLDAAGSPAPDAANPDPATCQVGAMDPTWIRSPQTAFSRYLKSDPLVPGGDWDQYYAKSAADSDVPFTAINGTKSGSTAASDNAFFNATTTNEASKIQVSPAGTASRQFEVQTTVESPGLGCGLRQGVASSASCWLVIVPRIDGVLAQNGPISPSLWAQRLQVKLGFRDVVAGCPGGDARILTAGSELASAATASWTPGLCGAKNIALGYSRVGDEVARNQLRSGAQDSILTTEPVDVPATYVPVSLSAPVIAYSLSYQPQCSATDTPFTESDAARCGYASLADLETDVARSGQAVRDLKLNARLVAKLLTQSYSFGIFDKVGFRRSGWMVDHRPSSLGDDPEFQRLNPSLAHISASSSAINEMNRLLVEAQRSDAAVALWNWVLADPEAKAFLDGCPDDDDMVVNPFYSTRTYEGCEDQKTALAAQADADRAATTTPSTYVDQALTYPPDGSPYPLPGWQETAPGNDTPTYTVFDWLARADSMPQAGRDTAIGYMPTNSDLCLTVNDVSCVPAPGKWRDPKTRQSGDQLGLMAVTDSSTAAAFQLPTAQLCDDDGTHCVGADAGSLTAAADRFTPTSTPGVVEPGAADYASGAYPLTMPVYAAVSTKLSADKQHAYGNALSYVTTTGQTPGFQPGNLPAGYAPLTTALRTQADAGVDALLAAADDLPPVVKTPKPTRTPTSTPTPSSTDTAAPTGDGANPTLPPNPPAAPSDPTVPAADLPSAGPSSPAAIIEAQLVPVAAGTESWPGWVLPFGLGLALVAGAAGPVLRLRPRLRGR